jgi:hypothetical protein
MLDKNLEQIDQSLNKKAEKPTSTNKNELYLQILEQNDIIETTVGNYLKLKNLLQSISTTKCNNLLKYLIDSIKIYHDKLKQILIK